MLSGFSQSRAEKTFSAWRQTDTTSEEELMRFPHLLQFWRANDGIFSASSFEQINAARHKGQRICLVTILTTYPVM
jgi:hypothetical protein